MLDEGSGVGMTGESDSMPSGGQAPCELDARVDHAGQTARYNEDTSHSRSTVKERTIFSSLGSLGTAGVRSRRHSITRLPGKATITSC
jgi:hypothetical protein